MTARRVRGWVGVFTPSPPLLWLCQLFSFFFWTHQRPPPPLPAYPPWLSWKTMNYENMNAIWMLAECYLCTVWIHILILTSYIFWLGVRTIFLFFCCYIFACHFVGNRQKQSGKRPQDQHPPPPPGPSPDAIFFFRDANASHRSIRHFRASWIKTIGWLVARRNASVYRTCMHARALCMDY